MEPLSPAERLIDEGDLILHAERDGCPHAVAAAQKIPLQRRLLAVLAFKATGDFPALMFRAMMDGWSDFKVRFELNKRLGRSGK